MRTYLLTLLVLVTATASADFHVAPTGKATNPGTAEAPFATLAQARDAIRALKAADSIPEGGLTVWVHAGAYEFVEPLALGAEDSGSPGAPIVYRTVKGDTVRFVGGPELPVEAFAAVTDAAIIKRIDPAAKDHLLCVDLAKLGVTALGQIPDVYSDPPAIPELFFNDTRMTLAQWPTEGWAEVAKVIDSGPAPWRKHASDQPGTFEYAGDRPKRWATAPDVWLHGYWCFDWRSQTIKAKSIDTDTRQITFVKPHIYGIGSGNPAPRRYQAINLLEELDAPGEYYIDRAASRLYFWPPKPLEDARVVLSTLSAPILELDGVSHVTVQGFTVEACTSTAIRVTDGREARIRACRVRNTGHDGIVVKGGEKHTIEGCEIHDTGQAGIRLEGGDRKTLTPCGHEAVNNHIHHVSRRQRTTAYHAHLRGVGIRLAHNLLHDSPHQSIGIGGNDHIIEFNEIHHISMDSDDCGAFYMGRNPSERGTMIRHNFWHHIGSDFAHGSCAVYFDDGAGGQTVFGNVFYKAAGGNFGAVFMHGGHDNLVDNNIFIECKAAMRQASWNDARWRKALAGDDYQNKLVRDIDISKPPYVDRYPALKGFMDYTDGPRVNYAKRNVVVNCDIFATGNWMCEDNLILDHDPGFVDAAALNFALKEDSLVYSQIRDFQRIPFEKIGIQHKL